MRAVFLSHASRDHRKAPRLRDLLPYAVQVFLTPKKELTVGDGRRCHDRLAERAPGQELKLRTCPDDRGDALEVGEIHLAVSGHGRGMVAASEPFAPKLRSG